MPQYLCSGKGCTQRLARAGKCSECKRAKWAYEDRLRGTAVERGYDGEYLANRALVLAESTLCWLCGLEGSTTADHVIPLEKHGTNAIENLRPAHGSCNSSKGSRV